ncbi:MAG: hypothetical protein B5M55_06550 [Desulfococcus sp. 4484_242]|nr:MAG: hypothetical protein B5M55_06550 [Desulfococcus sp. 4484_242]
MNPISETGSVPMSTEVMNKSPNQDLSQPENTVRPELAGQAVSGVDKSYGSRDDEKTGSDSANPPATEDLEGQIRKSEINDGKVTIKVYDYRGKLLRKIPPGYLPLGEQHFDITV